MELMLVIHNIFQICSEIQLKGFYLLNKKNGKEYYDLS